MTREEALKLWLPIVVMGVIKMPEVKEAVEMAITALESESRMSLVQEAVNTIMNTCNTDSITDKAMRNAAKFVQNAIDGSYPDFEKLDQEPCEDCISRQAVLDLIVVPMPTLTRKIKELPSVSPQPKMGCWIYHDGYIPYKHECSECGKRFGTDFNYCPNCGCAMKGELE